MEWNMEILRVMNSLKSHKMELIRAAIQTCQRNLYQVRQALADIDSIIPSIQQIREVIVECRSLIDRHNNSPAVVNRGPPNEHIRAAEQQVWNSEQETTIFENEVLNAHRSLRGDFQRIVNYREELERKLYFTSLADSMASLDAIEYSHFVWLPLVPLPTAQTLEERRRILREAILACKERLQRHMQNGGEA